MGKYGGSMCGKQRIVSLYVAYCIPHVFNIIENFFIAVRKERIPMGRNDSKEGKYYTYH